jgi:elongator complex protein 3
MLPPLNIIFLSKTGVYYGNRQKSQNNILSFLGVAKFLIFISLDLMNTTELSDIADIILLSLAESIHIDSKDSFHKLKNEILAKFRIAEWPSHIQLLERLEILVQQWKIRDEIRIRKVLRKRAVRSLSGVSVISLLTKFWWCPGKCIYCPTYEGLPKSYISDEPAVQRAEMNEFDPFLQVQNRLRSLQITGNAISKCDVRIIWGTWSVYPQMYQEDFIRQIYDAHTAFEVTQFASKSFFEDGSPFTSASGGMNTEFIPSTTLKEAKSRNEIAKSRVIGIAIETRPDWITPEEIIRLRSYGITRVEIGYQTTHDHVNILNKRGHGNEESIRATRMLKDAGFKVVAHMMPGLVGSNPELDKSSMREIFDNPDYRPDELKIYPLVVTPNSELTEIWKRGEFEPYSDAELIPLMGELQWYLPEYVRLNRMYRDIPASEILAGSKLANLRQVTEVYMRSHNITRHDISAREIRARWNNPQDALIESSLYEASDWHEWFIQVIDPSDRTIFGLLRLRIPSHIFTWESSSITILQNAAIIREVHVYGDQIPVGYTGDSSGQHMGFGKKMMQIAEQKVKDLYPNCQKIAVISGVWARWYYEKLDYDLIDEYMIKNIDNE